MANATGRLHQNENDLLERFSAVEDCCLLCADNAQCISYVVTQFDSEEYCSLYSTLHSGAGSFDDAAVAGNVREGNDTQGLLHVSC